MSCFTLLILSSWCLVIDVWFFLAVPWAYLQFVIVVFSDRTRLLFLRYWAIIKIKSKKLTEDYNYFIQLL